MEVTEWAESNKWDVVYFMDEESARDFSIRAIMDLYAEARFFTQFIDTCFQKFITHKLSFIELQGQNPVLRWIDKF